MPTIYKIVPRALWREAEKTGMFRGAEIDLADGFLHFSAKDQVAETARLHFAGQDDLLLVAVNAEELGEALKWETSRGGASFPHLYRDLAIDEVESVAEMPLVAGLHQIPGIDIPDIDD